MSKKRAFISFDYDHDLDLRNCLVAQAKNDDSPFEIEDWSLKDAISGDWKEKVRVRIKKTDLVIVICGEHTDTANGVAAELKIAQEENCPYFLLCGRPDKTIKKPTAVKSDDKLYSWTWDNLKKLIDGSR